MSEHVYQTGETPPPLDILERFLDEEQAGSIKVLALGDLAAHIRAESIIVQLKEIHGYSSPNVEVLTASMELAQVNETIRNRLIGPDAAEYRATYYENGVWDVYWEAYKVPVPEMEGMFNLQETHIRAATALMDDLVKINMAKSTQQDQ